MFGAISIPWLCREWNNPRLSFRKSLSRFPPLTIYLQHVHGVSVDDAIAFRWVNSNLAMSLIFTLALKLFAFGVFSQVKAGRTLKLYNEGSQAVRKEKTRLSNDSARLKQVRARTTEVKTTIRKLTNQLRESLAEGNEAEPTDVYQVLQITRTVRTTIDEPVVPKASAQPTLNANRAKKG